MVTGRVRASPLSIHLLLSSPHPPASSLTTTDMSNGAEITFDPSSLEPQIREILTAPGTDLGSISAKNVRNKLVGYRPILTAEYMKENKKAFDAVIGRVFEAVSAEAALAVASEQGSDTVRDDDEEEHVEEEQGDDMEDMEVEEEAPPKKKAKKASKGELSDAELARQLSSEINGRTRRTTTAPAKGSASKKKPKPKRGSTKKSAEIIDSDSDVDGSSPNKRKRAKSGSAGGGGGGTAKGGFAKEYALRFVSTILIIQACLC